MAPVKSSSASKQSKKLRKQRTTIISDETNADDVYDAYVYEYPPPPPNATPSNDPLVPSLPTDFVIPNSSVLVKTVAPDNTIPSPPEYVPRKESVVWQFASRNADGLTATCKICQMIIKTTNHSTTGLRKHFSQIHKIPTMEPTATKQMPKISNSFKQELHNLVVTAVVKDGRSFDDFRRPGMTHFLKKAVPGYIPPHRITVARRLKRLNDFHQDRLKQEMLSVNKVSITCDFWSDRTLKSYLCITGHHCSFEFDYKSTVLAFSAFYDRHQGVRIAKVIKEKLNNLNLYNKLQSVTSDGASNMVTMCQNLTNIDFEWIWCFAHRLHLTVNNALGFWPKKKKETPKSIDNMGNDITTLANDSRSIDISDIAVQPDAFNFNEEEQSDWDDAVKDRPNVQINMATTTDANDNDEMDIDDDNMFDVEQMGDQLTDEDFIDFVINNNLITDNWTLDASNSVDTPSVEKEGIYVVVKKCRVFINMTRQSTILSNYFDQIRVQMEIKRKLAGDCETRWNSTYFLIDSYLCLKILIMKFFGDKNLLNLRRDVIEKLIFIELQHDDWELLANLHKVLKPFDLATKLMSARSYPTIGLCYYSIQKLHVFLTNDSNDNWEIKNLKLMLLAKFEYYYYSDKEQLKILKKYAYFDPNGYSVLSEADIQNIENDLKNILRDDIAQQSQLSQATTVSNSPNIYSSSTVSNSSSILTSNLSSILNLISAQASSQSESKSSTMDLFLLACGEAHHPSHSKIPSRRLTINEEFRSYKKAMFDFINHERLTANSSIVFWKQNYTNLPLLAKLARAYLATPGTSVASESAFSISAYVARKQRARLSPDNLSFTMFLKDKLF